MIVQKCPQMRSNYTRELWLLLIERGHKNGHREMG
jgi:hypothetical protein